jgi:hypothetical protein
MRIRGKLFDLIDRVMPEPIKNIRYQIRIWRKTRHTPVLERLPESHVVRFRQDLTAVIVALEEHGVRPVLVTHATAFGNAVSPRDRALLVAWRSFYPTLDEAGFLDMEGRLNDVIRAEAAKRGHILVDAARQLHGREYFGDWAHFTDRGARVLASSIAAKLLEPADGTAQAHMDLSLAR